MSQQKALLNFFLCFSVFQNTLSPRQFNCLTETTDFFYVIEVFETRASPPPLPVRFGGKGGGI